MFGVEALFNLKFKTIKISIRLVKQVLITTEHKYDNLPIVIKIYSAEEIPINYLLCWFYMASVC